ncbi:efflux RND transporter periplasmic adaptor subunit [bacterium]|nr:efflux RND transporter periplasmic adaptor subunit [bacterium]
MRSLVTLAIGIAAVPLTLTSALAEAPALQTTRVIEWKAVYGQVESRDRIPARARLGGTLTDLSVIEGDLVTAGQPIGQIVDEKLAFQLSALAAQKSSVEAQLANAQTELKRGEDLLKQGVATAQGLDALRTQVNVLNGQLAAMNSQADVIAQQEKEGTILAPVAGRVLDVPVAKGGVVMPGEVIATIGGGGTFLRVAVPERFAQSLHQGDKIELAGTNGAETGTLSRVYPLIQNGRVVADVEIPGLSDTFVDARMLVRLPTGSRQALMVPATALTSLAGLDFVGVEDGGATVMRAVVPGQHQQVAGVDLVEVLSGLEVGDHVLPQAPALKGSVHE